MAIGIGDQAPDFTLDGAVGEERGTYTLSDYRGGPVVLAFYPGDASPVCTRQLNSYNDNMDGFSDLKATVIGLSPQDVESHIKFSCNEGGFDFPLLADTDKSVGEQYGIVGPLGLYRRSVFVIDAEGVVRYAHRAVAGLTYRSSDELIAALDSLS